MSKARFLVKSIGDDIEGAKAGLIKIIQLLDQCQDAVIVVPQLGNVKDSLLATILGPEHTKTLLKNRELIFEDRKKLSLCSTATLKNYRNASAYLALWGNKYDIEDIEALHAWQAVVLVTWQPEDSNEWEKKNKVEIIFP